jgi:uncharacterized membrane protein YkvA (DUF1232 family)
MAEVRKISFKLDAEDIAYFKRIFDAARKNASPDDWNKIQGGVRDLIDRVRSVKKAPQFILDAVQSLEDLMSMVEDVDYKPPKSVVARAVGALAYFAQSSDVIPDDVPAVGFLDDAIMIKFVEDELRHELWGYRKFKDFREGSEQRYWTDAARTRLAPKLEAKRKEIREAITAREQRDR